MSERAVIAGVSLARVMAHCGGDVRAAVHYLAGAIAAAPHDSQPYAVLAEWRRDWPPHLATLVDEPGSAETVLAQSFIRFLDGDMDAAALAIGSVTGLRPSVAWADAPWFSDQRFLDKVGADALAEAAMRTMDYGHDLDTDAMRQRFQPWFRAIERVSARQPMPEALARMAILLRACGLTGPSLALCDRADAVERIMLTEVVRAGTWRKLADLEQSAAAFERALSLDPQNWSLYLDLADIRAEQEDFTTAVELLRRGQHHAPNEITLKAAGAAYRARLTGSIADLSELVELASQLPNPTYRNLLIDRACDGPGLPAELVAAARRLQQA